MGGAIAHFFDSSPPRPNYRHQVGIRGRSGSRLAPLLSHSNAHRHVPARAFPVAGFSWITGLAALDQGVLPADYEFEGAFLHVFKSSFMFLEFGLRPQAVRADGPKGDCWHRSACSPLPCLTVADFEVAGDFHETSQISRGLLGEAMYGPRSRFDEAATPCAVKVHVASGWCSSWMCFPASPSPCGCGGCERALYHRRSRFSSTHPFRARGSSVLGNSGIPWEGSG